MPIPDFQSMMLPVLRESAESEVRITDVVDGLAAHFLLTGEERAQLLPSGRQTTFSNRVAWAKSFLARQDSSSRREEYMSGHRTSAGCAGCAAGRFLCPIYTRTRHRVERSVPPSLTI